MSLKTKTITTLIVIFLLSVVAEYSVQRLVIFPGFLALENKEAARDLERVRSAIHRELHQIDTTCNDYATWDETYSFVIAPSEDYIKKNLVDTMFSVNSIDLLYFTDLAGKVVWGKIMDSQTGKEIQLAEFPFAAFPRQHPPLSGLDDEQLIFEKEEHGVIMTEKGPMLVASRPILNSEGQGPSRGHLLVGRLLTDKVVASLANQTQVDFSISFPSGADSGYIVQDSHVASASLLGWGTELSTPLILSESFPDVYGREAFMVRVKKTRSIAMQGAITIKNAMLSSAATGGVILVGVLVLLSKLVLSPVAELCANILLVRKTKNLALWVTLPRADEIGTLSIEIEHMLNELEARSKEMFLIQDQLSSDIQHQKLVILEKTQQELERKEQLQHELLRHTVIAQEKERMRIARELHDEMAQALTAAGFTLAALRGILGDREDCIALIDRLREIDTGIASGLQRIIRNLRPAELDSLGLVEALRNLAREIQKNNWISITVKTGGEKLQTDTIVETVLFRVTQEALINAARHSDARDIRIVLDYAPEAVCLRITDDGKGFDPVAQEDSRSGWGIVGMRERVESVGGAFRLESSPGRGTTIVANIPTGGKP